MSGTGGFTFGKSAHMSESKGSKSESIPMHKELKTGTEHYLLKRLEEVG
jgi:hypothetical protein